MKTILAAGLLFFAMSLLHSKEVEVLAPGWGELKYELDPAGSYELPRLYPASNGEILLSSGEKAQLTEVFGGKISVLTFIYRRCSDVNGCPLATFVLHSLQKSLFEHEDFENKVRFISMSFDPVNDTPNVMKSYAEDFSQKDGYEWIFATTESKNKLNPILEAYGQYTFEVEGENGKSDFAHILRAFLIDTEGQVRNIYSVDFLHPKILLADIKTLLLEHS